MKANSWGRDCMQIFGQVLPNFSTTASSSETNWDLSHQLFGCELDRLTTRMLVLVTFLTYGDVLGTKRDQLVSKRPNFLCHFRFTKSKNILLKTKKSAFFLVWLLSDFFGPPSWSRAYTIHRCRLLVIGKGGNISSGGVWECLCNGNA